MPERKVIRMGTFKITTCAEEIISDIIKSERVTQGKYVRQVEEKWKSIHGSDFGVACSSGTDALILALGAIPCGKVILPACTFQASLNAVIHSGHQPIFVDIVPGTFLMDLNQVRKIIDREKKNISAVLAVHLFGRPLDLHSLLYMTAPYGIKLVEDAAEAHFSQWGKAKVGSAGDAGCFSFYIAHTISGAEGGIVITNSKIMAEKMRSLRAHGRACVCETCVMATGQGLCRKRFKEGVDQRFLAVNVGFNSKMNEMEAALILGQVDNWKAIAKKRIAIYGTLRELLKHIPQIEVPLEVSEEQHLVPIGFPIMVKPEHDKMKVVAYLEDKGIETRPIFGSLPTQHPAYAGFGYRLGDFPVAESTMKQGFWVGCHQDMDTNDAAYIYKIIREAFK